MSADRVISAAIVLALAAPALPARAQAPAMRASFDTASLAWDAGDYPAALERLLRLTRTAGSESLHRAIALLTGEWYRSTVITEDGTAPRWSADSRHFAWESGVGQAVRTHVATVDANGGVQPVAEIAGSGLVFSFDGARVAWLTVPDVPALRTARAELAQLNGAAAARTRMEIAALEREHAQLHVRDLATRTDRELDRGNLSVSTLAFGADGELYAAGNARGDTASVLVRLSGTGAPAATPLVRTGAEITSVQALAGTRFLVGLGRDGFAVLDPATGSQRRYEGTMPATSADGRFVVFVAGADDETAILLLDVSTNADPRLVKRSMLPIASPAVSPDGARIAFQMMPREDWEIYVIAADGSGETRITREIQHDLQPHFLTADTLLGLIGEGRHRLLEKTAMAMMVTRKGSIRKSW
jgi:hypothetical protein